MMAQVEHREPQVGTRRRRVDQPLHGCVGEAVRPRASDDEANFQHGFSSVPMRGLRPQERIGGRKKTRRLRPQPRRKTR
jgi:hypothetical protein